MSDTQVDIIDSLNDSREAIDRIDTQIVRLFTERMQHSRMIADYKETHHLPILNAEREADVLRSRAEMADDPHLSADITALFKEIMRLSKDEQYRYLDSKRTGKAVAYCGIPGAFSESAVVSFFGDGSERFSFRTFDEVFAAVADDRARYGVVPVENSSSGSVSDVYDLLGKHNCYIVGEQLVRVKHCLLGLPGAKVSDIRNVFSHEQGFAQCTDFLSAHPDWTHIPYFNTAISARHVAELGSISNAAIASRLAAVHYGLQVLVPDIHSFDGNHTRFFIVASAPHPIGVPNKATVTFALHHERGTLHRALSAFVALGFNLTHIESRPLHGSNWEYCFYVDVTGNISRENLAILMDALSSDCINCRLLGTYPSAQKADS